MILDLQQDLRPSASASSAADVCIIGAGAAGIFLALELVRQGKRVLLLEGGGHDIEEPSQEPYQSESVGLNHTGIHVGRFRAKGGSTTRWGGQVLELDDLDFEQRPWIPGSGWPIAKSELTPYYARALGLEHLALSNPDDRAVWRLIGEQMPAFPGLEPFFSRWCPVPNFSQLHCEPLKHDPNLELWLHANVVTLDCDGARIRSVRARTLGGVGATFFAHQFVFCLGGIESCRFFLQPEFSQKPWQQSGLLGKHFQDHIISRPARLEPLSQRSFHHRFDDIFIHGFKYQPKMRLGREIQAQRQTLNIAGMISFTSDLDEIAKVTRITARKILGPHRRQVTPEDRAILFSHLPLLVRMAWRFYARHRVYALPDSLIQLAVHSEQEPESKSSITLAGTRDSIGLLRTRIDWQVSQKEVDSIRTYVEVATQALAGVARVIPDPDLTADPARFLHKCVDYYHHMGGMRMAASPSNGIVDLDLRLHGMDNGYICSAAVFPTSGFSNPTHTVLALAVRLADHLAAR